MRRISSSQKAADHVLTNLVLTVNSLVYTFSTMVAISLEKLLGLTIFPVCIIYCICHYYCEPALHMNCKEDDFRTLGKMLGKALIIVLILLLLEPLILYCTDVDESAAMAKLAEGIHPKPFGWSVNSTVSICDWYGVACTKILNGHVNSIILGSQSLSGSLPSPFPSLPYLMILDLSRNKLTGQLPSLANLPSLEFLKLEGNNFTGMAHDFFVGLSAKLERLYLGDIPFIIPWTIPKEFSRLTNLTNFRAYNANVVGTLPDVSCFSYLETLELSYNSLSGSLPPSLGGSRITTLLLGHQKMKLVGNIQVLSSMSFIETVDLEENRFTGSIPDLSKCLKLSTLLLADNQLTGVVPESLASFHTISLSGNKLQGPKPDFLSENFFDGVSQDGNNFCTYNKSTCDPQVTVLIKIAGAFRYPLQLSDAWKGDDACKNWTSVSCNLDTKIMMINLGKQHFSGTISPAFAELTALQYLYLNDNNLTGGIPNGLVDLPHLKVLDVSNNNLSGEIPHFNSSVRLITAGNPLLRQAASTKVAGGKRKTVIITFVAILVTTTSGFCIFLIGRNTSKETGCCRAEQSDRQTIKKSRVLPWPSTS